MANGNVVKWSTCWLLRLCSKSFDAPLSGPFGAFQPFLDHSEPDRQTDWTGHTSVCYPQSNLFALRHSYKCLSAFIRLFAYSVDIRILILRFSSLDPHWYPDFSNCFYVQEVSSMLLFVRPLIWNMPAL